MVIKFTEHVEKSSAPPVEETKQMFFIRMYPFKATMQRCKHRNHPILYINQPFDVIIGIIKELSTITKRYSTTQTIIKDGLLQFLKGESQERVAPAITC